MVNKTSLIRFALNNTSLFGIDDGRSSFEPKLSVIELDSVLVESYGGKLPPGAGLMHVV